MLFMSIYTWKPGQRNGLLTRRMEKGDFVAKGMKVVGEWTDLGGGRGFMLYESNDPKAMMATALGWTDLMEIDTIPVMATADVMTMAGKGGGSKK